MIELFVAFGAGLISFLSPCVLPLIPGYISYISGSSINILIEKKNINLIPIILFTIGFSIILIVSLDRNSYNSTTQFWFDAPLEIIESPVETNVFTVICHGYAGSNEMMRQLAFDISRAGSNVVLFDFIGPGKSQELLVNKPEQIEGTTQQLVEQLEAVIKEIRKLYGAEVTISLVGHSMASDIVIGILQE